MIKKFWIFYVFALSFLAILVCQPQRSLAAQAASPSACAPSPHYGEITQDESWCAADSPHILSDSVVVNSGVTLIIEPGVTVMGSGTAELKTLGHLSAIGTPTQPITFTSTTDTGPMQWAGLSFDGGTGDLQYVTVRYGGGGGNSVGQGDIAVNNVTSGAVNIQNSTISDVSYSFYLQIVQCLWVINSHVTVDNTIFSGCATAGGQYGRNYPVYVSGPASVATLTNNTFVNNYKDRIALEPGAMMGQDATLWPQAVNGSYELLIQDTEVFTVPEGITLTVQAGVTVMGNLNRELLVQGRLEALGTPTQPVTFTSVVNSQPGEWSGIAIDGGSALLRDTLVRYAGGANSLGWRSGVTARNVQAGQVVLEDCTITGDEAGDAYTVSHGMVIDNSVARITNSAFMDNNVGGYYYGRSYPLYITGADSAVTLTGNTFTGNSRDKIGLAPGTFTAASTVALTAQAQLDGYEMDGSYTIPVANTLVLEPGVTLSGRNVQDELLVLGRLEAVGTADQPITFTSGDDSAWNQWPGVVFNGGTGHLSYVTARYAGIQSSLSTYGAINAVNVPAGGLVIENSQIDNNLNYGLQISNSSVNVDHTRFTDNGSIPRDNQDAIYADGSSTQLTLTRSLFKGNGRDLVLAAGSATLANNAFVGGWTGTYGGYNHAIVVGNGASATLLHNTIANLIGSGVYVASGGTADLSNSIFAKNSYGVYVEAGGTASLQASLWDRNGTNIVGAASENGGVSGIAGFARDGYHLTRYSMAIEQGVDAGASMDIDGEVRPLPAGTWPDLGADEFPYTFGDDFAAEAFAFDPLWVIEPNPETGNPSGMLRQGYFIRYFYGSPEVNPPSLDVSVVNALPDELVFTTQQTYPAMSFFAQDQTLQWQSLSPLGVDQSGEIIFSGLYNQPVPGQELVSQGELSAGDWHFPLQASAQVPLFSPLITFPGNGEICAGYEGPASLTVQGAAQNSAVIKFYENESYVGETIAATDGLFTYTLTSTLMGVYTTTLSARACLPSNPGECSEPFEVSLTPQQSFWDPQLSYWEFFTDNGTSVIERFRKNGLFTTQNSVRPRTQGFSHSVVHVHLCKPVDDLYVVADDVPYYPEPPEKLQINAYGVGETIINVSVAVYHPCSWLNATLNLDTWMDSTCALIDPDGYVFDVTGGFDPLDPSQHAVEGITVTCMYSAPFWGGWIPWPAQLYDNQVNPQVSGSTGHFAFFTPPGFYYLQVEGGEDYQPWRSPVIEVISEVVHMNVPLTPWFTGETYTLLMTPDGPAQSEITIKAGSAVIWQNELSGLLTPEEIMPLIVNPVMRILSDLDPQASTQGWDSGMLTPGQSYRRRFLVPGTYTYTDGYGHTGTIIVEGYRTYIPVVMQP